jgi:hypothetical protein
MAAGEDRFRGLINRLLYTDRGQKICSILFGFALAMMFRQVCPGGECKIILAPPLSHIQKTVFELEGDCYKYKPVPVKCPAAPTDVIPS